MPPWEGFLPACVIGAVRGTDVTVRRPKPLIPLNTALDNVNNSSNTSLSRIPAVLMLTSIASARNGERITSITTDVRFRVVFAFIRFVCSPVDATHSCFATTMTFTTGVPVGHAGIREVFRFVCSLRLTSSPGPRSLLLRVVDLNSVVLLGICGCRLRLTTFNHG